jgi:PAS domain S-box-containing protein
LIFLEPSAWEYSLLGLQSLLGLGILVSTRRDFAGIRRRVPLLLICLLAPLLSEHLFVLRFSSRGLMSPPGLPSTPPDPFAPILGTLSLAIAGAWLGSGPAFLVGLSKGILRAGTTTGSVADPFHLALLGFLIALLLRQDYRGFLPRLARQPIVTVPLLAALSALFPFVSAFARTADSSLVALDYALALTRARLFPALVEGLVASLVVQAAYVVCPSLRPVLAPRRSPPYGRTLNRRLLVLFVPLTGLITVVLVYAVTTTALRLATSGAVDQMARDANSAAEAIFGFVQTGQGLLAEFASDERLVTANQHSLERRLQRDIRTVVYFHQLMLFGAAGSELLAAYPPQATSDLQLTPEEQMLLQRTLDSGAPQVSSVHRSAEGRVILSFLALAADPEQMDGHTAPFGVLLGRTHLDVNPTLNRILATLQWTNARGEGFVVDSEGWIVAHSDSSQLLTRHELAEERTRLLDISGGWVYENRSPRDNTRQLAYYLPIDGVPWGVVIRVPYAVVLEQAGRIAAPLLGLQVLLGGGLIAVVSFATTWVTQPLQRLATAADRIALGDLSCPVDIPGEDEVARVGDAFEEMRLRLRDRMDDLSLLLEVSQSVSSTLELPQGVPFILEGALRATGAEVARMLLLSDDGEPLTTVSQGDSLQGLQAMDRQIARAVQHSEQPLIIENLSRARTLLDPHPLDGGLQALVALPIRTGRQVDGRLQGVMWIGFAAVQHFSDADIDLLTTLASQTAVLVENARLFETADSERRRLAAILASTTDAVLVTDCDDHLLLLNPAAERTFDIRCPQLIGQPIDQAPLPQAVVKLFQAPLDVGQALTREIPLKDGRTLYANLSAILSSDGQLLGRGAVMRDITHLKELDELKSDFVATVSHDLRAPLTYMRGYTTMLPAVGAINREQREYIEHILRGIGRMNRLVDDLLDLGRIEAGAGFDHQPCHIGAILLEAVDIVRAGATAKGIDLRLEPMRRSATHSDSPTIVSGDPALLRQAIANLLDNAIKYTPSGGHVSTGLSVLIDGARRQAVVHVSDTGFGIAPEDQVRLFEKFYRVRRRDAPTVPGTGLGLSIVKSIVEQHRGEVRLDSKLNRGTTVHIILPLMEPGPPGQDNLGQMSSRD